MFYLIACTGCIAAGLNTDRHFNLLSKYYCTFDCNNATFASCSDLANPDFIIYVINSNIDSYNFETSHLDELKNIGLSNLESRFNADFLQEFPNIESLKIIGYPIQNNNIEHLPDLTFMRNLKSINVYNNNLGRIWNMKYVDNDPLYKSKIDCDQLLPDSIDFIDMIANKISYLPSWLSNLVNLQYINLNYNELTYIPYGLFRNMKKLKFVHLNMNQLVRIDNFLPLSSLVNLDVKMQRSK